MNREPAQRQALRSTVRSRLERPLARLDREWSAEEAARPALRPAVVRLSRIDLRARCASDLLADEALRSCCTH